MQIARHPKDRQVHALLTAEDAHRLREVAERQDVPISQLVRRLIREGLTAGPASHEEDARHG